jgi:hypothetical protein
LKTWRALSIRPCYEGNTVDDDGEITIVAGVGVWGAYQAVLGVVGLAALPQVGLASLLPAELAARLGCVPGVLGGILGCTLFVLARLNKLSPRLAAIWGRARQIMHATSPSTFLTLMSLFNYWHHMTWRVLSARAWQIMPATSSATGETLVSVVNWHHLIWRDIGET